MFMLSRLSRRYSSFMDHPGWKFIANPKTVSFLSVPFNGGQPKKGVSEGPDAIKKNGICSQLNDLGWNVDELDSSKIPLASHKESDMVAHIKNPSYVGNVTKSVASLLEDAHRKSHFSLMIGGDHSLAIGSVAATSRKFKDFCLVWVDAHADLNTTDTTITGNLHGCPLSFILGLEQKYSLPGFEWVKACLEKNRLVYIGLRDVDKEEKRLIYKHKIKAFSMNEIDKYGIGKVMEMTLAHVNLNGELPIHLSFDVDALDPAVAPSTGTPVRGGLTFREGHYICEALAETGNVVAMDLVEVNPNIGDENARQNTVDVACSLIRTALGETLL